MAYPPVVIVDENDKIVGAAPLAEAWDKQLIHRIVFVVVENGRGSILLHRRAPSMQLYANCWDTAGGHVDAVPDYLETAKKELEEEVGITGVKLTKVAHIFTDEPYDNGVRARRFITIFHTDYNGEPGKLGEGEAVATRWFTKQELAELQAEHPEQVAEGLHRCLPYILVGYEDHLNQAASQAN